jgi:phage protein D
MAQKAIQIALNGTPVDQGLYGDMVSLTIEENTATANTFQLQFSTRLADDGTWSYLEDDQFALFNKASIKIGFTGGGGLAGALGAAVSALGGGSGDNNDALIPVFDGFVTTVLFESASEPGQSHFRVSGMDTSVLMSLEEKIATWKDMSDSDIVQQIVAAYGVEIKADSTPTVHQENDTTLVQRSSDIQFVRDLASRNGMEFYFETDKDSGNVVAHFHAPQLDGTPQPDLAIQFADKSNLESFSARVTGLRPLAVKMEQIDVKANGANSSQVTDTQLAKLGAKDSNALVGGPLGSLVTPKDAQAQMLVMGPPTSDATELKTITQSVRDEAGWFIIAEGRINCEAYQNVLRPHRIVLVKGAGKTYSGKYYVTRVVHELKGDGTFTESFEARRNARDVDGTEQFGGGGMGLPIPGV